MISDATGNLKLTPSFSAPVLASSCLGRESNAAIALGAQTGCAEHVLQDPLSADNGILGIVSGCASTGTAPGRPRGIAAPGPMNCFHQSATFNSAHPRSEERRVGKEC